MMLGYNLLINVFSDLKLFFLLFIEYIPIYQYFLILLLILSFISEAVIATLSNIIVHLVVFREIIIIFTLNFEFLKEIINI